MGLILRLLPLKYLSPGCCVQKQLHTYWSPTPARFDSERLHEEGENASACDDAAMPILNRVVNCTSARRRGGRVAEGGGLLNRCTG
jgi:hypothetical protein